MGTIHYSNVLYRVIHKFMETGPAKELLWNRLAERTGRSKGPYREFLWHEYLRSYAAADVDRRRGDTVLQWPQCAWVAAYGGWRTIHPCGGDRQPSHLLCAH